MNEKVIKLIGIFFIILIVAALTLFVMKKITAYWFWLIVIVSAVMAFKVLPWLKKS